MQTSYTQDPAVSYPGMPADGGFKDDLSTVVAETTGIEPGLVVIRGLEGDFTARLPPTAALDADSIMAAEATSVAPVTFDEGDADGVLGAGPYILPAKLILTIGAHADVAAGDWVLTYEDENGVVQSETFVAVVNVGGTFTTSGYARRFVSLLEPANDGTGGSFTLGTTASVTLDGGDVLGVSVRTHKASPSSAVADTEKYSDEETMPVRRKGRVWVTVENAFEAGDRPMVRCIATGEEKKGAIRVGTSDSGDCFPWSGARLLTSGSAGADGLLEINVL